MKMSWKNEQSNTGERVIVPSGTYRVRIAGWQECQSSKGNPQIRWFADIIEPETAEIVLPDGTKEEQSIVGKSLCEHTMLLSNCLFRVANLVGACGVELDNAPDMEVGTEAFKKMLDACLRKTTYWQVKMDEQYGNNKIEGYTTDPAQESQVVEFGTEEIPF